jgi:hypothetical protein
LQRHGFRLSDDEDLFHSDNVDIPSVAERDIAALRTAGLAVDVLRPHEGLVEAVVSKVCEGSTRVQWVQSGALRYGSGRTAFLPAATARMAASSRGSCRCWSAQPPAASCR